MKNSALANADKNDSVIDSHDNRPLQYPLSLKGFKRSFTIFPEIGGDSRQFLTFFQERRGVDQFRAWMIFILGFMVDTICLGVLSSYGIFYMKFLEEFPEHKRYTIAAVGSSAFAVVLLASPIVCVLNYRRGQWPLVLLGGVSASGALLLSSYLTEMTHFFLSYSLLYGLSACLMYCPSTLIANTCFLRHRIIVSGFFVAASCSGILVVLPAAHMLMKLYDWRVVLRLMAGALMLCSCSAVTYSWMKRFYEVDQKWDPDELQWEGNTTFMEMIRLFRHKRFLLWILISSAYACIHFIPYINLVEFGIDSGLSKDKAAVLVMFIGISGLPTRLVVCRTLDVEWLNKKMMYMAAMMGCGIIFACIPLVPTYTFLMALILLWGVLESFVVVLAPAVTVQVMGWQHSPAAWNVMHWVHAVPLALGPVAAAWYRDTSDSYNTVFHVFGGFVTVMAVLVSALPSSDTVVHHTDSWPHVPPHDATYRRVEGQQANAAQHGPAGEARSGLMPWQPSSVVETAVGPFLTNMTTSEPRLHSPRTTAPPATLVLPGAMYVQATTLLSSSGTSDDTGGWEPSMLVASILGENGGAGEGFSSSRHHLGIQSMSSSYDGFHHSNIGAASTSRANVFATSESRPTIGEAGDRVPSMPVVVDVIGSSSGQDDDNDNAMLLGPTRATAGPSSLSSRRMSLHHMQGGDLYAMQKTAEGNVTEEIGYSGLMDDEAGGMISGVEHSSSIEVMPVDEAGDAIRRYPMTPPPPIPTGSHYRDCVRFQPREHRAPISCKTSSTSRGTSDDSTSHSVESIRIGIAASQESAAYLLGDDGNSAKRAGGGGESQESLQYVTPPTSMLSLVKSKSAAPDQLMSGRRRDRNHFEVEQSKLSLKRRVWSAGGIERHLARSAKSVLNPCAEPQPACFNASSSARGTTSGETKCIIESVETDEEESTDDGNVIKMPPYVGCNLVEHVRKIQSLQLTQSTINVQEEFHAKSDDTNLRGWKNNTSDAVVKEQKEEWPQSKNVLTPPPTEGSNYSGARDNAYSWVAAAAELVAAAVKGVSHTDSSKKMVKTPEPEGVIGGAGECMMHCTPIKLSSKESSQSWSSATEDLSDKTLSWPRSEKRKTDSTSSQSHKKMAIMKEFIRPKGSRPRREPAGQENFNRVDTTASEPTHQKNPDVSISLNTPSSQSKKCSATNSKNKSASPAGHVAGLMHTVALAAAALVRGTPPAKEAAPLLESATPSPPTQTPNPQPVPDSNVKPHASPIRPKPTVIAVQEAQRQRLLHVKSNNDSTSPSSSSGLTSAAEYNANKWTNDASGETSPGSVQSANKTFPLDILSILNLLEMVDENIVLVAESMYASMVAPDSVSPTPPVVQKLAESSPLLRATLKLARSQKSVSATTSCTSTLMISKKPSTVATMMTSTQKEIGGDGDLPRGIIMVAPTITDTLDDDLDLLVDHDDGRKSEDSLSSSSDDIPDETHKRFSDTGVLASEQPQKAGSEASVDSAFAKPRYKSSRLPLVNRQLTHLSGKREVRSAGQLRLRTPNYLYSGDGTKASENSSYSKNNGGEELLASAGRSKSLDALLWLMSTKTAVVNTASLKKEIASAADQKEVLNLLRQNPSTLSVASHESTVTIKANSQSSISSPAGISNSSQLVCKADDYVHMSTDQHSTINLINFSSTSSEDGEMEKDGDKGSITDGSTVSSSQLQTVSSTEESCLRVFSPSRMIPITVESEANSPLTLTSNSSSTAVIDMRRKSRTKPSFIQDTENGGTHTKPNLDKSMAPFLNPTLSNEMLENPDQMEESELAWWPFSLFIPEARGTAFANVDLQSLVNCYPFFGDIGRMKPEDIANILLKADENVGEGSEVKTDPQASLINTREGKECTVASRRPSRGSSRGRKQHSITNSKDGGTADDITWVSSFDEMTDSSIGDEVADDLSSVSEGRTGGSSGGSNSGNSPQKMRRRKRRKKLAKQTSGW